MGLSQFVINAQVISDVGKVRKNNEDNFVFFNHINQNSTNSIEFVDYGDTRKVQCFGVFDGMGGHAFGERASLLCAKTAQTYEIDKHNILKSLASITAESNQLVCNEMKEKKARIGSTLSMLAFYDNKAYVTNVGDTPIYILRNHQLYPIYEEHTERKMYEKIYGYADPSKKYKLTQNIGVFESEMLIKPYMNEMEIADGDIFVIASDGLTDMVNESQITEILNEENHLLTHIKLKDAALDNGGKDNITIILIYIKKKKLFGIL